MTQSSGQNGHLVVIAARTSIGKFGGASASVRRLAVLCRGDGSATAAFGSLNR